MSSLTELPGLLVPIHVDGLVVGKKLPPDELFQWTNLAPNFSLLRKKYLFGPELVSNGDPFNGAPELEPGIHIHFRLPAALTHGNQEGGGDLSFPPVPNRWLVQRYGGSGEANARWAFKAWLIRSDGDSPDGVTWPVFREDGQVEFMRFGACDEVKDPLADHDGPARMKITAIGPADPAFSAFYPACRGILGFHDPLTDIPGVSRLSYLVTGWYSDPNDDPLTAFLHGRTRKRKKPQFAKFQAWTAKQGWTVDGLKADDPLPTRILCHGLVRGIVWQGPEMNYMQPSGQGAALSRPLVFPPNTATHEKGYRIAVGNTAAEAMAALLVSGETDQDLLAALQDDMLSQPVTAADLQYELHERRFGGVHSGTVFHIRHEPSQPDADKLNEPSKPAGDAPIPLELRELLRNLNTAQQECDQRSRRVEDWTWQVYALWYLWTGESRKLAMEYKEETKSRVHLFKEQLGNARNYLEIEQTAWNTAKKELKEAAEKLRAELGRYPKTPPDGTRGSNEAGKDGLKYRLSSSSAGPFQRPNDPVIAVQGPAMDWINSEPQAKSLKCRISGREITEIALQVPAGKLVSITGEQLMAGMFADQSALRVSAGIHRNLLGESLLLDDQLASDIAGRASIQDKGELTATVKELQNLRITGKKEKLIAPNALIGARPDTTGIFDWTGNPWIPLFLVWEVLWRSDYQDDQPLPEDLIARFWRLGENAESGLDCDLVPRDKNEKIAQGDGQKCLGYSILTPSAANNLAKRLKALTGSHPLIDILSKVNMQTLILDGFNDALILQQPGLQLPPLDFEKWFASRGKSYVFYPVHSAVSDGFKDPKDASPGQQRKSDDYILGLVHDAINRGFVPQRDTFRTTPRSNDGPFLPIRSGRIKIQRLSIVDAFGQTLKLPVGRINQSAGEDWHTRMLHRTHSFAVGSSRPRTDEASVMLRPRFAQPVRLRFEWEQASDGPEKNCGPVCGWILPNHLEKNFMVYSATGKPLGALQKKLGLEPGSTAPAFYWVDVPREGDTGKAVPEQENIEKHLASIIQNTHLLYFCRWVLSLIPDHGGFFSAVIDQAMASSDQRVPEEDPGVAVLVGRPLALVRAGLQFEPAGLPAHRPKLRPGSAETPGADSLLDTGGFQKVKWPLRLGDLHARNDGLIGVFTCSPAEPGGAAMTVGPFYPVWGWEQKIENERIPPFAVQNFEIDAVRRLQVTMLMDPQARVHATTGALPRTFLELPHENVTGAKRAREVFFQTAPVLGISATPQMPKPSDDYGEWSWAYRPDVTRWKLDPAIVEATNRAAFSDTWPAIAEGWLNS